MTAAEPLDIDGIEARHRVADDPKNRYNALAAFRDRRALLAEVKRLREQEQRIRETVDRWAAFKTYGDFREARVDAEGWHDAAEIIAAALDGGAS